MENLKKAFETSSEGERKAALGESLEQFKNAVDSYVDLALLEICSSFCHLSFHEGAIELCLTRAKKIDPEDLASGYVENKASASDGEALKLYDARVRCYDLVFAVLNGLQRHITEGIPLANVDDPKVYYYQVFSNALSHKDRLFHYKVYEWLIKSGREKELFEFDTDYLIPYFETLVGGVRSKEFLWRYFRLRERFYDAALCLYALAVDPSDLKLPQRIQALSFAIVNAQCRDPKSLLKQEATELLPRLERQMSIAKAQYRLQQVLKERGPEEQDTARLLDERLLSQNELDQCAKSFKVASF